MDKEEIEKTKKAGEIHAKACVFARGLIKKDMKLLDIAEKIESEVARLGGKCAFPVNLSINEIAAHATPAWNDEGKAGGLLKVDIGVHVDGYVADGAFTIDMENNEENKILIKCAEEGLKKGTDILEFGVKLGEVGKKIEEEVKKSGFVTIRNLTGHKIDRYVLHAGVNVPNYDSGQEQEIEEGVYAVEPFTTNGLGRVRDGRASGIYKLQGDGSVRDGFAREVLKFLDEEYEGLPFCSRWVVKIGRAHV